MGNCLDFILVLFNRAPMATAATDNIPKRVTINCACFNSKVVDDLDSSVSDETKEQEKVEDEDDEYFSFE